jgi:hypothetical protein
VTIQRKTLRGLGVACIIRPPHSHPGRCSPVPGNLSRACGRLTAVLLDIESQARLKRKRVWYERQPFRVDALIFCVQKPHTTFPKTSCSLSGHMSTYNDCLNQIPAFITTVIGFRFRCHSPNLSHSFFRAYFLSTIAQSKYTLNLIVFSISLCVRRSHRAKTTLYLRNDDESK